MIERVYGSRRSLTGTRPVVRWLLPASAWLCKLGVLRAASGRADGHPRGRGSISEQGRDPKEIQEDFQAEDQKQAVLQGTCGPPLKVSGEAVSE